MSGRVFSNAIWNVVNASSGAAVAVVVPPFLTHFLTPEAYGAWALALQLGAYVSLFGFGIQIAVGRFVAFSEARGDIAQRDGIVATSFWVLMASALVGIACIYVLAANAQWLVPKLSPELAGETRAAIMLVGLSLAANLPASVFAAVFIGRQESHVAALIQGSGRLLLAVALIAAGTSRDLAVLGAVYAGVSALTVFALWFAWRRWTHAPTIAYAKASRRFIRDLVDFCFSLTIWNIAMLLVNGLDLIVVGRYDYRATAYFAVSVTLVTFVTGTLTSLSNALIPEAAKIHADDQTEGLTALLFRSSRMIIGASILIAAPLIVTGDVILTWWLGHAYAVQATPILVVLAIAILLRNIMLPYVTIAIGIGYQRKITLTPLAEGVIAVGSGIALAHGFGAVGVASGKIVGGFCGVLLLFLQHPLREPMGGLTRWSFVQQCVLRPVAGLLTAIIGYELVMRAIPVQIGVVRVCISGLTSLAAVYFVVLNKGDRTAALRLAASRRPAFLTGRSRAGGETSDFGV